MTETWTMVAETRTDLASYLATLTPEQWNAPTLCDKWKVRDVVGHLVEGANKIPMGKMVGGMLKSGFNLNKMLVSSQVALSLLLIVGAGLFGRSLRNLWHLDSGKLSLFLCETRKGHFKSMSE